MKDQEQRALKLDRNVALAVSKGIRVFLKNPIVKFFGKNIVASSISKFGVRTRTSSNYCSRVLKT